MDSQLWFYYLAGVPLLGIIAQWIAWRLRLPSILLLLAIGLALGAFVNPDELIARLAQSDESVAPKLLLPFVSLAVAVILLEGGLSLKVRELQQSGGAVLRLVLIGGLVSWLLIWGAAWWVLRLDGRVAALLGAVLIVTGPTVVSPLLRHIRPSRRVGSIVKWEGIVIDPIGAVLAVLVFEQVFLGHGPTLGHALIPLAKTIFLGGGLGVICGWFLTQVLTRYWIPDFLHGVAFLATGLASFAIANSVQEESGLVTVTVMGVMLANQKSVSIRHVVEFKEHLQVFLISCLFIVLGSRLDPSELRDVGWRGLAFLAALILVIRPLSIWAATLGSALKWNERLFLALLAPRGIVAAAVASVFALRLVALAANHEELAPLAAQAEKLVPVTFLVIVGTVAIYGLLAAPLARLLGLADSRPQGILFAGAEPWLRSLAKTIHECGYPVMMVDTNYANIAAARMAGLPADCSSILSEHVREELDLAGIGRMLAVTANDEVNTLAVNEFSHTFGRQHVYQLAPWDSGSGRRESISEELRGRLLFDEELHHDVLSEQAGVETIKKTKLSDEFVLEDFRRLYGESAVILFVVKAGGDLQIATADNALEPESGDTVIALISEVRIVDTEEIAGDGEDEGASSDQSAAGATGDE